MIHDADSAVMHSKWLAEFPSAVFCSLRNQRQKLRDLLCHCGDGKTVANYDLQVRFFRTSGLDGTGHIFAEVASQIRTKQVFVFGTGLRCYFKQFPFGNESRREIPLKAEFGSYRI